MLICASAPRAPPCSARIRAFAPSSAPALVDVRPASSAGRRRAGASRPSRRPCSGRAASSSLTCGKIGLLATRPSRLPAAESSRPGVSPPETAAAAPRDGEIGEKIAKSPIFPHIGRRERDGAGASGQRPDRKRGRGTPVGRYTPKGESERMFHVKHSESREGARLPPAPRAPTPRATPLPHNEATPARRTRRGRYRRSMRLRTRPRAPPRRRWRARGARPLRRWRPPP